MSYTVTIALNFDHRENVNAADRVKRRAGGVLNTNFLSLKVILALYYRE